MSIPKPLALVLFILAACALLGLSVFLGMVAYMVSILDITMGLTVAVLALLPAVFLGMVSTLFLDWWNGLQVTRA